MKYNHFDNETEQKLTELIINDKTETKSIIDIRYYHIKGVFEFSFSPYSNILIKMLDDLQVYFYSVCNDDEIIQIILDEYNSAHNDTLAF